MQMMMQAQRVGAQPHVAACVHRALGHGITPGLCRTQARGSVERCLNGRCQAVHVCSLRAMASSTSMADQIREKNEKYPIMIYAKSYCPFCGQVKGLFKKLGVEFQSVNLDEIHEGEEIQDELAGITGSSTVPQVFVDGEFIGGCDETMKLNSSGELKKLLEKAGIPQASA